MSPDEAALVPLWREKRGAAEPEDVLGNLAVQLGAWPRERGYADVPGDVQPSPGNAPLLVGVNVDPLTVAPPVEENGRSSRTYPKIGLRRHRALRRSPKGHGGPGRANGGGQRHCSARTLCNKRWSLESFISKKQLSTQYFWCGASARRPSENSICEAKPALTPNLII